MIASLSLFGACASAALADGGAGSSGTGSAGTGSTGTGASGGNGGSTTSGSTASSGTSTGGDGVAAPPTQPSTPKHPTVPGFVAKVIDGVAYAPSYAPIEVQRAIWAGNQIRHKPYIWGGGHAHFASAGYDCSGSVSFVLHAAGLLKSPFDSSEFMSWGVKGLGQWITVYTNPGHAFIQIAGIRLDTSSEADPHPAKGSGPRWRPLYKKPKGFLARHPRGY